MSNIKSFQNTAGKKWNVRVVGKGDVYGRNFCLTHADDEPLVEFYDADQSAEKFGALGQFVSRYYFDTLTGKCEFSRTGGIKNGINLHGGVESWGIDAKTGAVIANWLSEQEQSK